MSKIQVRFWNKNDSKYDENQDYLLVIDGDEHCVYEGHSYVSFGIDEKHLEPHFFLNEERIA